jgi:putative addiction module component (TIGR02574 family)
MSKMGRDIGGGCGPIGVPTMRLNDIPEIARLSVPERILLLEDLWESIASEPSSVPVPGSHRAELDRRLAEYERDPGKLLTLEELRQRIEAQG